MMSSRWEFPTRKKWNVPLWTPTDIFKRMFPAEEEIAPIERSVLRIPAAARAPREEWSGPSNSSNSASPPNLIRPPPLPYATARSRPKTEARTSVTSSAPTFPLRARRSDIFVKPEMSTNTSVPSISRTVSFGDSASHWIASRGR